jgi:S-adenosylmethionine uptake transporter
MQALWTLAATFLFTIMGVCVKAAAQMLPMSQIVVFRGLPSVLVLGTWMLLTHKAFRTPALPMHLKRNGMGVLSMWLGFVALSHLPLATATTLSYTAPLFIVITLFLTGRGMMDRGRLLAVVLGFLGVLAVLLGCGLSGLAGQFALTRAFGKGSALLSAALQYSAILFAALAGLLFWAEVPDAMALLGMALIVAAGLLASWRTYRLSQSGRSGA